MQLTNGYFVISRLGRALGRAQGCWGWGAGRREKVVQPQDSSRTRQPRQQSPGHLTHPLPKTQRVWPGHPIARPAHPCHHHHWPQRHHTGCLSQSHGWRSSGPGELRSSAEPTTYGSDVSREGFYTQGTEQHALSASVLTVPSVATRSSPPPHKAGVIFISEKRGTRKQFASRGARARVGGRI